MGIDPIGRLKIDSILIELEDLLLMLQWCHSLAGRNIGHSFGQIYHPCHK
jgi:hypothetical protein